MSTKSQLAAKSKQLSHAFGCGHSTTFLVLATAGSAVIGTAIGFFVGFVIADETDSPIGRWRKALSEGEGYFGYPEDPDIHEPLHEVIGELDEDDPDDLGDDVVSPFTPGSIAQDQR